MSNINHAQSLAKLLAMPNKLQPFHQRFNYDMKNYFHFQELDVCSFFGNYFQTLFVMMAIGPTANIFGVHNGFIHYLGVPDHAPYAGKSNQIPRTGIYIEPGNAPAPSPSQSKTLHYLIGTLSS